jgi:hypothetical protein
MVYFVIVSYPFYCPFSIGWLYVLLFSFTFFLFALRLSYALRLVNLFGFAEFGLAGTGGFWAAGELAYCHNHISFCLVAVGRQSFFYLYADCDSGPCYFG